METDMNKDTSKLPGRSSKHSLGTIQDLMKRQSRLSDGFEDLVDAEKEMVTDELAQVKSVAKFVKANWKTIAPAVAVLGLGAYLLKGRNLLSKK
jgi:hypothetical protein